MVRMYSGSELCTNIIDFKKFTARVRKTGQSRIKGLIILHSRGVFTKLFLKSNSALSISQKIYLCPIKFFSITIIFSFIVFYSPVFLNKGIQKFISSQYPCPLYNEEIILSFETNLSSELLILVIFFPKNTKILVYRLRPQ